jgi:Tol biopolymer transport system component
MMRADGSELRTVTNPPRAGEWENANLPFGDYDPKISPDGMKIVFERMIGDTSQHGNYDLITINVNGTHLMNITHTGYSQGLVGWSPTGDQIAYIVSAMDDVGLFDLFLVNSDGTANRNITPHSAPNEFLVKFPFSGEEDLLFFIGEWFSE